MVKDTEKFDRERRVLSTRFAHFWSVPKRDTGCLLSLAGRYKPSTGLCHSHMRSPQNHRAGLLTCFTQSVSFIHTSTLQSQQYSRKHVHQENKELELQASLPCPEESRISPQDERLLLSHEKTPGFLASGGEEFNLGPETRLDHSELLCNKVLLKYKGDRESF